MALGVAADAFALEFLAALPEQKRQPNLLLAALRHVVGTPRDWPDFRCHAAPHVDAVRATMLARRTQTNEAGRCAALLPVLARLPQPLALLEVGASAGLCLLPDRYGYDYGDRRLPAPSPDAPVFPCRAQLATPLPAALPRVVWRLGLDLDPVDVADAADCAWLETLVWPEQSDRLRRLRAALAVARRDPPRVVQGDLLAGICRPMRGRRRRMRRLSCSIRRCSPTWPMPPCVRRSATPCARSVPSGSATRCRASSRRSSGVSARPGPRGAFLLSVDGSPVAWTDPHGGWIEWIGGEEGSG